MTRHTATDAGRVDRAATDAGSRSVGRGHGERGTAMVAGITLLFAFTFLGLVWLARDVDRGVSNRSTAQSIAFQSARSGAQAAAIGTIRTGGPVTAIDADNARRRALQTADGLFTSYGVDGTVTSVSVDAASVSVTVEIVDGTVTVTGAATVRAERAP